MKLIFWGIIFFLIYYAYDQGLLDDFISDFETGFTIGSKNISELSCKEDIKKNAVLGTFTCSTCPPGKSGCNQEIFDMSDTFLEWSELHCETNEGETSHGVKFWYASCGCGSSGLSGSAEVGCTKCTPKPQRN